VVAQVAGVGARQHVQLVAGGGQAGAVVAADGAHADHGIPAKVALVIGHGRKLSGGPGVRFDPMDDRLYFRQLLCGRDVAQRDPMARQMVNFVYLVGDREAGEAVVIDAAYDIPGILGLLDADGMRLTGALATHYHADHVGGSMFSAQIPGIAELLAARPVPIHVQADEARWVQRSTGVDQSELQTHASGDVVMVGDIPIELIHTPGHTPGSQCFLVDNRLVAGDTLFLQGCGRTDLPGGDPAKLYESLTQKLAKVPDDAVLYPGHLYSPEPDAPMGEVRRDNVVFRPRSADEWLRMFA
jgi:glyoxylase-like metal-dependent hydrolase (beta-lactamase superfamily II)